MNGFRPGPRVALITNMISPYRVPLFNELNRRLNGRLKVMALDRREENRQWDVAEEAFGFAYEYLPGVHKFIWSKELPLHLNRGVWASLRGYAPDVIVTSGYDTPAYWQALTYAKVHGKRLVLWNGTTLLSTGETKGTVGLMKRLFIRHSDSFVSYGTLAAEYLKHMGASEDRISVGLNTVDMSWYRGKVLDLAQSADLQAARKGYPEFLLLYVGQLIPRKGLMHVLKALALLSDCDIGLLVLGSGPQRAELLEFCHANNLNTVYFEGFKQQAEMPRYYALADALILPSLKEVWGLVVNEALACGLYALCSDRTGAAHDLVSAGWNGDVFDVDDCEDLARLIGRVKERVGDIRSRREAISQDACSRFGIDRSASAMMDAITQRGHN